MRISHPDLLLNNSYFNIEHRKYYQGYTMPETHFHEHYEIYYQAYGDRYYFIKDKTYHIHDGDLVLINKSSIHKTLEANKHSCERILIDFHESFLDIFKNIDLTSLISCFSQNTPVLRLNLNQKEEVTTLLSKLMIENTLNPESFYTKLLLTELLILINRYLETSTQNQHLTVKSSAKYKKVAEIADYINCHYREELTLDNLAHKFYISPSYLSRLFKDGTGWNLTTYISYTRIDNAKSLLKDTTLSILDIAHEVGFQNLTHFGRIFKNFTGVPPSKYRSLG